MDRVGGMPADVQEHSSSNWNNTQNEDKNKPAIDKPHLCYYIASLDGQRHTLLNYFRLLAQRPREPLLFPNSPPFSLPTRQPTLSLIHSFNFLTPRSVPLPMCLLTRPTTIINGPASRTPSGRGMLPTGRTKPRDGLQVLHLLLPLRVVAVSTFQNCFS